LLVPVGILAVVAAVCRPRLLWPLLAAGLIVLGPVMGFRIPRWSAPEVRPGAPPLRVLTCNTQGSHLDKARFRSLIEETGPDVVLCQEWSEANALPVFGESGWHVYQGHGQCLASRHPLRLVRVLEGSALGGRGALVHCEWATPRGSVQLVGLHLASPREGIEAVLGRKFAGVPDLEANIARRRHESEVARNWVDEIRGPLLLAGDFNLPDDSAIYARYWSEFSDAFQGAGLGWGYTKYTRLFGARIDHVLAGPGWRFRRCWVGPDVGSDHRPVIAEVE
jgi:endonuclease/exonuclease/phosphatase (EEP) superfamily protein YafD